MPYPAAYIQALWGAGLTTRSTREEMALLDEETLEDLLISLLQVLSALEGAGNSTPHMLEVVRKVIVGVEAKTFIAKTAIRGLEIICSGLSLGEEYTVPGVGWKCVK